MDISIVMDYVKDFPNRITFPGTTEIVINISQNNLAHKCCNSTWFLEIISYYSFLMKIILIW